MGKYFDTAFLSVASFIVMFTLLSFTEKDMRLVGVMSALAAFCVSVLFNAVLKKTGQQKTKRRKNSASKKVKALIYAEENAAINAVYMLLKKKYRLHSEFADNGYLMFKENVKETVYALCVIRKYKVSQDDVLSVWRDLKRKGTAKKILIVIPGKADADVKAMPLKLKVPEIQILDKLQLKRLIKKYDMEIALDTNEKPDRPGARLFLFINRKRALRYIGCALLLAWYYLMFGQILNLVFASILAFVSIFSLLSDNTYESLF